MQSGVDDFEAAVTQRPRDNLCAAIVAVEPGLRDQNSESLFRHRLNPAWVCVHAKLCPKDIAYFADRRVAPHRLANRLHQIFAGATCLRNARERFLDGNGVSFALDLAHALNLPLFDLGINLERRDRNLLRDRVLVDADHRLDSLLKLTLKVKSGLGDLALRSEERRV